MPDSIAAFVAQTASSTLSFFSFCSMSDCAPTYITPTPPERTERRSSKNFISAGIFSSSNRAFTSAMRLSMASLSPWPPTMTVPSAVVVLLSALPKSSIVTRVASLPIFSDKYLPPVTTAMSCIISSVFHPNCGGIMLQAFIVPLTLFIVKVLIALGAMLPIMSMLCPL